VHEGQRPLLELLACLYNALQVVVWFANDGCQTNVGFLSMF
jgi:hypothetical protein